MKLNFREVLDFFNDSKKIRMIFQTFGGADFYLHVVSAQTALLERSSPVKYPTV